MPHEIQRASSGRAKCRACKAAIGKDTLRLGEEVPNAFGAGEAKHWYHLRCGALRRPQAFLAALASLPSELSAEVSDDERTRLSAVAESGTESYRLSRFVKVEVAPSGRARCQGCRELIEKGALRFVLERIEDGMVSGAGFVHVDCAHAYAGAVDHVLERVESGSDLTEEAWDIVRAALERQAELPREKRIPRRPGGGEDAGESEGDEPN